MQERGAMQHMCDCQVWSLGPVAPGPRALPSTRFKFLMEQVYLDPNLKMIMKNKANLNNEYYFSILSLQQFMDCNLGLPAQALVTADIFAHEFLLQ